MGGRARVGAWGVGLGWEHGGWDSGGCMEVGLGRCGWGRWMQVGVSGANNIISFLYFTRIYRMSHNTYLAS